MGIILKIYIKLSLKMSNKYKQIKSLFERESFKFRSMIFQYKRHFLKNNELQKQKYNKIRQDY
ncbi:hypothetical protein B0A66_15180 [Flavobacterium hercynium]|uniref:Uncharacterized protein n=1 Tax=Flavobacterium hercynium TaxID=387094 RepID=A0A226H481_9FLAO|nr:hypothetical protein B0A66_15180 [Flavobacterium hercynium]